MRKLASLSGKVKKNPSSQADSNRYEFLDLQNAEPDFGVPTSNSAVLSSEIDGTRKFLYLDASTFSISNNIITATAAAGDADFLDGQDGAYYLDFTNFTNVPDPVITLSGDATGSTTLTNLANGTITVTVTDNSHNHTVSNISDFTAGANTAIDNRVTKSFVDALNVDADTLDGANGSFYLDYNNFTNTPSIPTSGVDFDPVGTDNSTDVTLAGSYDYLTIAGQQITLGQIDYSTDISNLPTLYTTADANTDIDARVTQAFVNALNVDADTLDGINSTSFLRSDANTSMSTGYLTLANDPTTSLHAATKQYVDTIAAAGIHYHSPVRAEVIGNMTATYNNGTSGVGATLTNAGTQTAFVADGVSLDVGDRVLVYEQTDATQNGVYVVTTVGDGSTNWVLTRADDADSYAPSDPDALGEGDAFFVKEGDTAAGELYVCNTTGTITFGTTNITFIQIAATAVFTAGSGIDLSGTTFSVAAGSGLTQDASGLSHADTSTQASLTALTGANVVSDIDLDGFGHVTSLATRAMTLADLGYTGATDADNYGNWGLYTDNTFRNNITSGENVNFLGGNSITVSYSATNNITINHADTSTQASLTALTGANVVSDIDLDGFGHVTALSTREMTLADFDANLSSFVSTFTLPTVDGSNGQVLTTNGSGTLSFTDAAGGGSYSNSDVDAHLNTSTAANNQVLSWTGSDYDWIDQSAGGDGLTQEQLDTLEILQDDSAYFYTSIGDLYDLSSPKGPNSSIQINDDGIFGGYSSLTYNTTSETLSANNISLLGDLTVSNNISVANNISVLSLDASGDVTVVGDINVGTINTYSIDEIRDRGQLNSSDSAYFYTKLEEIEETFTSSIDVHLNTSTAANNQVLSWTGADYDWVDQSAGGGGITTGKAIAMAIVFG
jgi:hypothetical protein